MAGQGAIPTEFGSKGAAAFSGAPASDPALAARGWRQSNFFTEGNADADHSVYIQPNGHKGLPGLSSQETGFNNTDYVPPSPPVGQKTQAQIDQEKADINRAKARDIKGGGIGSDVPAQPTSTMGALSIQTPTLLGG